MTRQDIKETRAAMKKVEAKYGKTPEKAKTFLKKMGYLTRAGKVSSVYSESKKKAGAR